MRKLILVIALVTVIGVVIIYPMAIVAQCCPEEDSKEHHEKGCSKSKGVLMQEEKVKDYVCGMEIDKSTAKATEKYKGLTFYFCSGECHKKFKKEPNIYSKKMSNDYDEYAGFVFNHYLSIHKALIEDKVDSVQEHADKIIANADTLAKLEPSLKTAELEDMQELAGKIEESAKSLSIEKYTCPMHPEVVSDKQGKCPKCNMNLVKKPLNLEDAREQFGILSNAIIDYYKKIDKEEKNERNVYIFYCDMSKKFWLQENKDTPQNPYYGLKMLNCGKLQESDEHKGRIH